MSALETQLLFARTVLLVGIYTFLATVALVALRDLRAAGRETASSEGNSETPRAVILSPGESGRAAGTWFPIRDVTSIGRGLDNEIVVQDPTISARHAVILRRDAAWWLEDFGSTNGTWVGGRRLESGVPEVVRSGDLLQFGSVRLRFVTAEVDRERAT